MSIKGGKPNDRRIVAHLMVPNGREVVDFYRRAFVAQSLYVSELPGGRIVHAQLRVEQSVLMMTEDTLREGHEAPPPMEAKLASPKTLGGTTFMLELYVDDVDTAFKRALDAGGKTVVEPQEMFYGDRYGILRDPFGFLWALATVKEELTPDEVNRRAMSLFATSS